MNGYTYAFFWADGNVWIGRDDRLFPSATRAAQAAQSELNRLADAGADVYFRLYAVPCDRDGTVSISDPS